MISRSAFTLIELMIVIGIIAIIASIAVPNLLESRVTAQEAAAAATLRSGLMPAQIQFKAGCYCDLNGNGIGTYAVDGIRGLGGAPVNPYNALCGTATLAGNVTLNLLPTTFTSSTPYSSFNATVQSPTAAATAGTLWPTISNYTFKTPITQQAPITASDGTAEQSWGVLVFPVDDTQGRKFYLVSQTGTVYMSKPSSVASDGAIYSGGQASSVTDGSAFGLSLSSLPSTLFYLPYHR